MTCSTSRRPTGVPVIVEGLYSYQIGGSERLGAELATGLARRGYEVLCLAFYDSQGPLRTQIESQGIECLDMNYLAGRRATRRVAYQLNFANFLRRRKIRALHVHHATSLILCGIPARLTRVPSLIMTEHSIHQFKESPSYRRSAIMYSRLAHQVTVVHPSLLPYFLEELKVPADRLHCIPNGVALTAANSKSHELRRALAVADSHFLLVYAGRLHPVKDVGTLIEAVSRVSADIRARLRVWIVGDGEERRSLEAKSIELGLGGTISFLGARSDVKEIFHEADAFIMTSLTEGLPMSLLEAMAARLPCIATAVGGIPELLSGDAGLLAQPRDVQGIAAAIDSLVRDAGLREKIAAQAVARIAAEHNLETTIDRYLELMRLPAYWPAVG